MDRIAENLNRNIVWNALAIAFRPPENGSLDITPELSEAAARLRMDAAPFLDALEGAQDLREAYDRIFGHIVRGPCPAHEGEYGEPRGMYFAHEIGDVQGFYRAFGLKTSRRLGERADHIAVECEFMAFLALKEACALDVHGEEQAEVCRDAGAKFLRDHLGRFGRTLATRIRQQTDDPVYREAAALLDDAIRRDAAVFGVTYGPGDLPLREDAGTPEDACISCAKFRGTPQ